MGINLYVISVTVVALAAIYLQFYGIFGSSAIPAIRIFVACIGGIVCGFVLVLRNSKYRKPIVLEKPKNVQEMSDFMDKVTQIHFHVPYKHSTIVTNTIDKEIQEVFDLFIRDFCLSWFQNLGKDEHAFKEILTKELWDITYSFVSKLQQVDMVKFLSNDLVNLLCSHFQELRLSDQRRFPGTAKPFVLHPCLSSDTAELEYLRTASEAMLYALLSKRNSDSAPLRLLLREILAYTVFQPMFERICDPDYINQTLLWYLESKEKLSESHKKDYAYAETYEEFIRLINTSQDIEHVKGLR
jgi:sorting nexin-25